MVSINEGLKALREAFKNLKVAISEIANIPKENKVLIYHQTKWEMIRDTRLRSQVTNNKPRHLIKKVIR